MGLPTKLTPGDDLSRYPGGTHNWLIDRVQELLGRQALDQPTAGGARKVLVQNKTGANLTTPYSILRLDKPLNDPELAANDEQYRPHIRLKGLKPSQDTEDGKTPFMILQRPALDGDLGECVLSGPSWAKVDLKTAGDKVCGPVLDDVVKLISGQGSTPILWAPSGVTGEKWCLVELGGANASAQVVGALAIIKGTVPASSAIDVTGDLTVGGGKTVGTAGRLAVTKTATTFTAGALLVEATGSPPTVVKPLLDNDDEVRAVDAINPSYTDFIGEDGGVFTEGLLITNADGSEFFLIPTFDLRSLPGFVLGSDTEDDAQAIYHEGLLRDFKLGRTDCGS